jgi:hypothetical protein
LGKKAGAALQVQEQDMYADECAIGSLLAEGPKWFEYRSFNPSG